MRTLIPGSPLDTSDLPIKRVGFGAWALDGGGWSFGWSRDDDSDSSEASRHPLDLASGWIDTTDVGDAGRSSEVDGEPRNSFPADRPYVFTKCGLIWDVGTRTAEPRRSRWPVSIREKSEASLRQLGLERIDLYQLWPDEVGARMEQFSRPTTPACAGHRTGVRWYSPWQIDLLAEAFWRAPMSAIPVAVAWTLTSRGVAGAIVGASSAGEIDRWVNAVTLVLTRANIGEIVSAIAATGARSGARIPAVLAA